MAKKNRKPAGKSQSESPAAPENAAPTLADRFSSLFPTSGAEATASSRKSSRKARAARVEALQQQAADKLAAGVDNDELANAFQKRMTVQEAMRAALHAVNAGNVYDGKYLGRGLDLGDIEIYDPLLDDKNLLADAVELPDHAEAPSPERALFENLMGPAQDTRFNRQLNALRDRDWVGFRWRTAHDFDSLSDEELGEPGLTEAQRKLLKRSRKHSIRELTIRLQTLAQALIAVEMFVRHCCTDGLPFVRVITGKGLRSSEGPVLKPAVIEWCSGTGRQWVRGWAPETDHSGAFGSIVLELKTSRTPSS
jgi:DNA-nicking Smr family endonuclease